jgi:hypothetical protein
MSKLNFIHICENAFITEGTKSLNLIGIFDGINSPGFPAIHPKFSIVANVDTEVNENHKTTLKIRKDSKVIFSLDINFVGIKQQIVQNFINFPFPEEGVYVAEVVVDSITIGSTNITLKKVPIDDRDRK